MTKSIVVCLLACLLCLCGYFYSKNSNVFVIKTPVEIINSNNLDGTIKNLPKNENENELNFKKPDIDLILIQGGSFMMGNKKGRDDEKPVHKVNINDFYMSKTEITVDQYRKCVESGVCDNPNEFHEYSNDDCNWRHTDRLNHPINCLSWKQARAFAKWVGGDLPSEAQWEYAARSRGKDIKYPWGNTNATCQHQFLCDISCEFTIINNGYSNSGGRGCGKNRTWEVCKKKKGNTEQDLCDMEGNVSEWVLDDLHDNYEEAPNNDQGWCKNQEHDCIHSENDIIAKNYRGSNWKTFYFEYYVTKRQDLLQDEGLSTIGFRIVKKIQ